MSFYNLELRKSFDYYLHKFSSMPEEELKNHLYSSDTPDYRLWLDILNPFCDRMPCAFAARNILDSRKSKQVLDSKITESEEKMPPSGFNQDAINGLLVFVRDVYTNTLNKYSGTSFSEKEFLEQSSQHLEKIVKESIVPIRNTVSSEGLNGLVTFCTENYRDLIKEIQVGKKSEGQAMQYEIEHISTYLKNFKI